MKRQDYLSWDAYFMGVAMLSAERSKDNNTQVGACIVSPGNKILSMGYNGMPTGCDDDRMPWERKGTPLDTKYLYVCHAELNAILNYSGGSLKGARIYTTLFPCNECTKAIIQAGIRMVVTNPLEVRNDIKDPTWRDKLDYSRQMFEESGVAYIVLDNK